MKREERMEQIKEIVTKKLKLTHVVTLDESMRLQEDLLIDSIMLLQLIVYIEEELQLMVPAKELDPRTFLTVGYLLDFIEQLQPVNTTALSSTPTQ
ncbi:petrobactin biosynthesis protein AsbD [Brevibacillus laterosporus]|uniref:petrobactin biosynthesis protein AsbD n=1 Tax=Brevibacillus laterosporus TaxID=1465 RepID=UPI000CE51A7A|nr:petrobactin biosynthesis protein AsbD [Brevibacillus laterosporus]MED1662983.1 petrobactin biosynthesis protein AsbD [Brevibacillus laterosporus]MED1668959.1 petrobactin biosynthesis protein AsbD [Brevibacillus laterosporus]MED1716540.1 petrobactin biosynthesis protein AsbD [Brevibacillus laterosporus]PPA86379.1 acyl carrier protein [Brevibacillus laterosporus]